MKTRKHKGAALLVVMMVMAVMTILGASILNVSVSEARQASQEDKRMQAQYLARSGAEAALSAWEGAVSAGNTPPGGNCNTVYLNSSNQFVNSDPGAGSEIGRFDVTITPPQSGGTSTVITSIGTVGNVQQTSTVTITTTTTQVTIPGSPAVQGDTLGWYDLTSGQINTGTYINGAGKTIEFNVKSGKGLKIPSQNSPKADFTADKMLFTSPIDILHNSIILTANSIAIYQPIDFSQNKDGKGNLIIKVPTGGGVTRSDKSGKWGILYYINKAYYYPDTYGGTIIDSESDITSLDAVPAGSSGASDPFGSSTQTITSYSLLWS